MVTTVKLVKMAKLKAPVIFTGLPGIGLVGKIVVDYLLKELNTEKIAEIISDSFPPSAHTKEGMLELIKDEIYHYSFKGKDYLFLSGPVQPSLDFRSGTAQEHYEFARSICEFLKQHDVKEIYALAGINVGERRMNHEPKVIVAATSKALLNDLKKYGVIIDKNEGLISGAAGLLPGIAAEFGMDAACLMGETNVRLVYGDHGAAKKVLELLIKKFGFKVDMRKIEKESVEIEKAFTQLSAQLEEQEEKPLPSGLSYVR
ncbi:MAG: PAC2 family protein [Candidatus Diapherotrites archaeon]|uniref:PAC2 family protein n=1 Tax=Candidatus Iainarchaeum sp. TaxID=3101447 RepID=A0A8T4KTY9_9ARCH|nr:PAC2 family protein [Candidatus Diapherotrites archaeon]